MIGSVVLVELYRLPELGLGLDEAAKAKQVPAKIGVAARVIWVGPHRISDRNIMDACRQLGKNRRMLQGREATVKMPPGWPAFSDVQWTWAVGTPQQLYTGPLPEPEMFATSFRYVKSLGTLRTIETLINTLRKPDVPRLGEHYTVEKTTMHLGRYVIHWDTIHALDKPWTPQPA